MRNTAPIAPFPLRAGTQNLARRKRGAALLGQMHGSDRAGDLQLLLADQSGVHERE